MAIPKYEELMIPYLKAISDGREYHIKEVIEILANQYNLSDEERKELLDSGAQPRFDNRVGWARAYMLKAGLLESSKRAFIKISDEGRRVLDSGVKNIDSKFLRKYPSFLVFQNLNRRDNSVEENTFDKKICPEETPEERIEDAFLAIKSGLAAEILTKVLELTPNQFEKLVVELLVKMGYGGSIHDAGKAIGQTNDQGIDGIIKEDKLGLDKIYIQAKRWSAQATIGRPELQKFVGALAGQGATKGVFITTSSFTREAIDYKPANVTIVKIDGKMLAEFMIDYNLGVSISSIYELKKLDLDYFESV